MVHPAQRVWARYVLVFLVAIICSQSTKANDFTCKTNEVQFKCPNSDKCIPKTWECDKENDCGDNSDEQNCGQCDPSEKFSCKDGTCIFGQWKCDGVPDCKDKSDEDSMLCAPQTCSSSEFTCSNKKCIPEKWKCDHDYDCDDKSDENDCRSQPCPDTMFQCNNSKCIDKKWKCDHDDDCDDGSDEDHCEPQSCSDSEFQCDKTRCISKNYVCDNFYDCHDTTDELQNCQGKSSCKEDTFECKSGGCIQKSWVCDADVDCPKGEDERNCPCPEGEVRCQNGSCIKKSLKCDRKPDCIDKSDEKNCGPEKPKKCSEQQFECKSSKICINDSQVCDGKPDCDDGSDESKLCGKNECLQDVGCQHNCTNIKIGYRCSCNQGYELTEDNKNCADIDECKELGKCSQICQNNKGTYKCSCVAGYRLDGKDLRSCKAIERDPYLVFSDRHSIRKLTLHQSKFVGIVPNLPGSIAVDYDLTEKWMYWTDINNETIQRTRLLKEDDVETKVETIITSTRTPDGIAVDWVARKLYWTDAWYKRIEVSELDGTKRRVLIDSGLHMPRALVLHPAIGEMFWTDWGKSPKIEKCGMDGDPTSRKAIITEDIRWPNALTLDYTIDHIWWADAKRHVIEHCDLNGQNRKIVLTEEHVFHPFSISVFEDHVYWTDWFKLSIYKANKFTGNNCTQLKKDLLHPMGISVIHPQRQPAAFNFCQMFNGGCSHLCLLSARRNKTKRYSCSCPGKIELLPDGRTCNTPESLKCVKDMCNNGTCIPGNAVRGPQCICNEGFSGLRCEYKLPGDVVKARQDHDDIAVTIGISVGVVAVIFISGVIVGIVIYKKLQKRYNPSALDFENPVYTKTTESIDSGGSLMSFISRKSPPKPPFAKDPEPVDL